MTRIRKTKNKNTSKTTADETSIDDELMTFMSKLPNPSQVMDEDEDSTSGTMSVSSLTISETTDTQQERSHQSGPHVGRGSLTTVQIHSNPNKRPIEETEEDRCQDPELVRETTLDRLNSIKKEIQRPTVEEGRTIQVKKYQRMVPHNIAEQDNILNIEEIDAPAGGSRTVEVNYPPGTYTVSQDIIDYFEGKTSCPPIGLDKAKKDWFRDLWDGLVDPPEDLDIFHFMAIIPSHVKNQEYQRKLAVASNNLYTARFRMRGRSTRSTRSKQQTPYNPPHPEAL